MVHVAAAVLLSAAVPLALATNATLSLTDPRTAHRALQRGNRFFDPVLSSSRSSSPPTTAASSPSERFPGSGSAAPIHHQVPMRDGVVLNTLVFLPPLHLPGRRVGTVMIRTPYGAAEEGWAAALLFQADLAHPVAVVLQDDRGTGPNATDPGFPRELSPAARQTCVRCCQWQRHGAVSDRVETRSVCGCRLRGDSCRWPLPVSEF